MTEHDYARDIDTLRRDLGRLQSDLQSLTRAVSQDARLKTRGAFEDISEQADDVARRTRRAYQHGVSEVSHEIERHPFASLLTAAGLGFVVGTLARR